MKGLAIYILVITSCTSKERHDPNRDSLNLVRQFCPYNDFCQFPATKIIHDTSQSPCCRPCSCDSDCQQLQSCCPDKQTDSEDLPNTLGTKKMTCKTTVLSWTKQLTDTDYETFKRRNPHFLITDNCPVNETNEELIRKCKSTDMSNIDKFLWVSDEETGQIFQNRFCASCHMVRNFVHWTIGIIDCLFQLDDSLPVESIFQINDCILILDQPSNMQSLTADYRCFMPYISHCNATGEWEQFNETINTGCNNIDMPFITETNSREIDLVYKNIFCFMCNPDGSPLFDVCQAGSFRFLTTVSFLGILDFNRRSEDTCNFDEIFDQVLEKCHRMFCQLGWTPSGGACLKNHVVNPGSSIRVLYKLKLLLPSSTVTMNRTFSELVHSRIKSTGIAVFSSALGYEEKGCNPCLQELFTIRNYQNTTMRNFYLYNVVGTTSQCNLEILRLHMISYLETSLELDSDLSIFFRFEKLNIDNLNYMTGNYTSFGNIAKPFACGNTQTLTSAKACPRLILSYSDIASLPAGKTRAELLKLLKHSDDETVDICIKDYFDLLYHINAGNRLKHVSMCVLITVVSRALRPEVILYLPFSDF